MIIAGYSERISMREPISKLNVGHFMVVAFIVEAALVLGFLLC